MQYLPLFADLRGRACLVVGGGGVAERKVAQLLAAGARVTVIAPGLTAGLEALRDDGTLSHERAELGSAAIERLDEYWLVVAATDDLDVNARVARAAQALKRLCNVVDDPARCSFIMPAIIDREPVTIAVSSGGTSPMVARWVKGLIEAAVPARVGALATLAGRWRERVKAALPDATSRRRFWHSVLTGGTAELSLAGNAEASERALEAALAEWRATRSSGATGEAYLVGAGPGNPELLTIRGRHLLAQADAVLYDRLVNPKILDYARRDAELICVGKKARKPSIAQSQLNRLLVQLVKSGKRVCRLKGGDPMIFGRVGEELEALTQAGLPFQIVPGVSAVEGCAAYAGIPLTLRGGSQALLITTGHTKDHVTADLASFAAGQTLALYMAVANLPAVAAELERNGHSPSTPAVIVENGTCEDQRVIRATLRNLAARAAEHEVQSPALVLVGESARLAERYAWFNPGLAGAADEATHRSLARVG